MILILSRCNSSLNCGMVSGTWILCWAYGKFQYLHITSLFKYYGIILFSEIIELVMIKAIWLIYRKICYPLMLTLFILYIIMMDCNFCHTTILINSHLFSICGEESLHFSTLLSLLPTKRKHYCGLYRRGEHCSVSRPGQKTISIFLVFS